GEGHTAPHEDRRDDRRGRPRPEDERRDQCRHGAAHEQPDPHAGVHPADYVRDMAGSRVEGVHDLRLILWIQGLRAFLYGFGTVLLGSVFASGLSPAGAGGVFTAMLAGM